MISYVMGYSLDDWKKVVSEKYLSEALSKQDYLKLSPYLPALDKLKAEGLLERKNKMTREEASDKIYPYTMSKEKSFELLCVLEALGLIKFDDKPKEITPLIQITTTGNVKWAELEVCKEVAEKFGAVIVAQWPKGLVLWVGGRMVWQSWKDVDQRG